MNHEYLTVFTIAVPSTESVTDTEQVELCASVERTLCFTILMAMQREKALCNAVSLTLKHVPGTTATACIISKCISSV